jgi:hypothetical protein
MRYRRARVIKQKVDREHFDSIERELRKAESFVKDLEQDTKPEHLLA